MFVLSEEDVFL